MTSALADAARARSWACRAGRGACSRGAASRAPRTRAASWPPTSATTRSTLPGVRGGLRADPRPRRARLADRRVRRLRRRRRLLDGDPRCARCAPSAPTPSGSCPAASTRATGCRRGAVERLAARGRGPARDGRLRDHRRRARWPRRARAGLDVVVTDHHRPGDAAARLPRRASRRSAATPCPELCAAGRRAQALRGAAAAPAAIRGAERGPRPRRAGDRLRPRAAARREPPHRARGPGRAGAHAQAGPARADGGVAASSPAELDRAGARLPARRRASTPPGACSRADAALELLLTEDDGRAAEVARELDLLNRDRQAGRDAHPVRRRGRLRAAGAAGRRSSSPGEGWHPGRGRHRGLAAGRALAPALRGDRPRRRRRGPRLGPQHLAPTTCTPGWPPAPST